jgi:hypothetical protein
LSEFPFRIEAEEAQFPIPARSAGEIATIGSEEQMFGAE